MPWFNPWKWCRDLSVVQHISLGAVWVRLCQLYYNLIENCTGFLQECCQWCWTQGIFLQLVEVRCCGNFCTLSCLPCSCVWSWLMHLWGLVVVLQLPTALWTAGACIMSVCHHCTGISQLQCHWALVLCWVLAFWWLWWPHSVLGDHLAQTEWIKGALCPVLLWWWFLVCSAAWKSVPAIFSSALTSLWGWMHCPCSGVVMCFVSMDHTWPWLFHRSFLSHYSWQKLVTPWRCSPTTGLSLL